MIRRASPPRPFSLVTACVIGAAGAASMMSLVLSRLLVAGTLEASPAACDDVTATAELAGFAAFEHANAEYEQTVVRAQTEALTDDDTRAAWASVRDRYRLFLAHPEAVARWPELTALARDRADHLDQFAVLEQRKARGRHKIHLDLVHGPDCTLGAP